MRHIHEKRLRFDNANLRLHSIINGIIFFETSALGKPIQKILLKILRNIVQLFKLQAILGTQSYQLVCQEKSHVVVYKIHIYQ